MSRYDNSAIGSYHPRQGYRFNQGFEVKNSKRVQMRWRLGHDRKLATEKAEVLAALWRLTRGEHNGMKVWSPESISEAKRQLAEIEDRVALRGATPVALDFLAQLSETQRQQVLGILQGAVPATPQPYVAPVSQPSEQPDKTFFQALDELKSAEEERLEANEIRPVTYRAAADRIAALKHYLAKYDEPLRHFDHAKLLALKRTFTARPVTKRGTPMSLQTVENMLSALSWVFDWARRKEYWHPKPDWENVFALSKAQQANITTKEDRKPKKKHYNVEELQVVWHLATPKLRLMILIAVNCGWTQTQIANMEVDWLVEKDGEHFIDGRRNKNGNPGVWWVHPRLARMLKESLAYREAPTPDDGLMFHTEKGNSLVRCGEKAGKADVISDMWDEDLVPLLKQWGVPNIGFGHLRHTSSQMIRNVAGPHMQQVFLAHSTAKTADGKSTKGASVADIHYSAKDAQTGVGKNDYEKLWDAQKQVWQTLEKMFEKPTKQIRIIAEELAAPSAVK